MADKPLIGITKPDNEGLFAYGAFWFAVKLAGGAPVMLSASHEDYKGVEIDGLLLGGGKDVFPGLYNFTPKEDYIYDQERDAMEVFWAERARDENIPTLGICRGAQLMNIVCGGTLHMSVAEAYEDAHYPDGFIHNALYRKAIKLTNGCLLHDIIKLPTLKVNSIHKQAIDKIGTGLSVNAVEDNGVIQAISMSNHPFFLGVQFHPEFMIYRDVFRNIFGALVAQAAKRHS